MSPLYIPESASGIPITAFTAKGDMLVGTGANAYSALPVGGTNGWVLVVDNTTATGTKWAAVTASATQVSLDSGVAGDHVARAKLTADTQYRVSVGMDAGNYGQVLFGAGGVTAPDVVLSRSGPGSLMLGNNSQSNYTRLLLSPSQANTGMLSLSSSHLSSGAADITMMGGTTGQSQILLWDHVTDSFAQITLSTSSAGSGTGMMMSAGSADVDLRLYRSGTKYLTIDDGAAGPVTLGLVGLLNLADQADPAVPAAGHLLLYAKSVAGRMMTKQIGPSGVDTQLQTSLFSNRVILWTPGTGTVPLYSGQTGTVGATCSHPTPVTSTNIAASVSRAQFTTTAVAANTAGLRSPVGTICFGNATARGGFFYNCRFHGGTLHTTGRQVMVGLSSSVAALAGDPSSTMADFIGMCLDAADGTWQFTRRTGSGAATKVALTGYTAAADQLFDLTMYAVPGVTTLNVRILKYNNDGTATVVLDTSYATVLPAVGTLLGAHFQVRNGALVAAHNIAMSRIYVESDF